MRDSLSGIFPPIPTPFDPSSGEVDLRALETNVHRWMRTGLAGILALGSNGEAALLDERESDAIVATVREAMPSERMLLVGTARESTRATIAASIRASKQGASAVIVRTPSFFKSQMTNDALIAHFRAVADASHVPVLLYNLPGPTGITLTPPVVAALAQHSNIIGMKETSPDLERLGQFVDLDESFRVLCGWAPVAYPALVRGAAGAILAVANVLPDACVTMYEHTVGGRHDEARACQRDLTHVAQLVTSVYGVAGLKVALDLEGYHGGPVRSPLLPASAKAREEIAHALSRWHQDQEHALSARQSAG